MTKILLISLAVFLSVHGLVHLLGFIAYWPLGKISELPYKTTLLGGRLEIGSAGTRLVSVLWLLVALGFIGSVVALALGTTMWAKVVLGSALLSLVLCSLDWATAFRGAWISAAVLVVSTVTVGLQVNPASFPAFTAQTSTSETLPLPAGLPAPVERFYRQTYGDSIPVYRSAVMSGRGTVRLMGVTLPARMRFSHISGQGYHHYIEANLYGLPILKVNEWYLAGRCRLELPFGVVENDPCADSAANQSLWAESLLYPALLLTDKRARWEAIDDSSAALYVPFGDSEQEFIIQFDPQTGAISYYETQRCKDRKNGAVRWWGDLFYAENEYGKPPNQVISAAWEDEGSAWMIYELEDSVFNNDLNSYIHLRGP